MTVDDILTRVREMAGQDEELLQRILQTASEKHPVDSFCPVKRLMPRFEGVPTEAVRILQC